MIRPTKKRKANPKKVDKKVNLLLIDNVDEKQNESSFHIKMISKDGNCLFRSVSHQLYGTSKLYHLIRTECVNYLRSEKNFFQGFIGSRTGTRSYQSYCRRMAQNKTWGGHPELQALSEIYNRPIEIYSEDLELSHSIFIAERMIGWQHEARPIRLSYHNGDHYNSVISSNINNHQMFILDPRNAGDAERQAVSRTNSEDRALDTKKTQ